MDHYGPFYTLGVGALCCACCDRVGVEDCHPWSRRCFSPGAAVIMPASIRPEHLPGWGGKSMMDNPCGGALISPLGNGSEFNWIIIILTVMLFDVVHILNLGSVLIKLSAEWVRERVTCPIRRDSLRQVWRLAMVLARAFVFVSSEMWDALHREGPSWANSLQFSLRPFISHPLNTHIKL